MSPFNFFTFNQPPLECHVAGYVPVLQMSLYVVTGTKICYTHPWKKQVKFEGHQKTEPAHGAICPNGTCAGPCSMHTRGSYPLFVRKGEAAPQGLMNVIPFARTADRLAMLKKTCIRVLA